MVFALPQIPGNMGSPVQNVLAGGARALIAGNPLVGVVVGAAQRLAAQDGAAAPPGNAVDALERAVTAAAVGVVTHRVARVADGAQRVLQIPAVGHIARQMLPRDFYPDRVLRNVVAVARRVDEEAAQRSPLLRAGLAQAAPQYVQQVEQLANGVVRVARHPGVAQLVSALAPPLPVAPPPLTSAISIQLDAGLMEPPERSGAQQGPARGFATQQRRSTGEPVASISKLGGNVHHSDAVPGSDDRRLVPPAALGPPSQQRTSAPAAVPIVAAAPEAGPVRYQASPARLPASAMQAQWWYPCVCNHGCWTTDPHLRRPQRVGSFAVSAIHGNPHALPAPRGLPPETPIELSRTANGWVAQFVPPSPAQRPGTSARPVA